MENRMLSNKDRYELLFNQFDKAIELSDEVEIKKLIEDSHTADITMVFEDLDNDYRQILFPYLNHEQAAHALSDLSSDEFFIFYNPLSIEQKVAILDEMSDDDIADILGEASEELKEKLIKLLDEEEAKELTELMSYDEDTAGGIMTKEFISLEARMTVEEAMVYLRKHAPDAETIYYVYVTDKLGKLVGILSLRELVVAEPSDLISNIMSEKVIHARVDTDQEEVAAMVRDYDFLMIPIVDHNDKLLGIVTFDDVMDIIEEEATEDILKFAGTSEYDFEEYENTVWRSVFYSVKSRLPWLIITIFGGVLSASVVNKFQHVLALDTAIALFMPLLAGMGGNVGTQSSTLTVRTLALKDVKGLDALRLLVQEMLVGFAVGIVCALIIAIISKIINGRLILSLVVAIAMFANISTAAFIGTVVPLAFKRMGVDPAVASAPFITTTVDITGLFIYFYLALLLLKHIT